MQIRIEIDVKPEELRRFLGIPDVSGLPEDLAQLARNLAESASGRLDPGTLLKANLDVVRNNPTLRRIWLGAGAPPAEAPASPASPADDAPPQRRGARLRRRPKPKG